MSDSTVLTDEEIVERVRSDDRELFAVLMDRYTDKLLRYANHLVHDEGGAQHIVQDAFINAYIHLHGFDVQKKFSSWLYRIVHNEAMNVVKKYKKEIPLIDDFDMKDDYSLEEEFEQKEIQAQVETCLSALPLLYSEPLSLYYLDDKSYEEISTILRIPMGTVATRIRRAKKIIKKICQKN
ncbi:MAG: sigma-70 family RNA polymerase sigma factor [Candidatus Paceibacterota bacterium]